MLGSVTTETDHSYGEPLKFSPASRTSSKDDMNYQKKKKKKRNKAVPDGLMLSRVREP